MKIALGTAQFGSAYGTFNRQGQPSDASVAAILERASVAGIDALDTARAYGESEDVLGRLAAARRFRIVTKVPELGEAGPDAVRRSLDLSLAKLGSDRVAGLMLHSAADLLGAQGDLHWAALEAAQAEGLVERIGVSVYAPDEALTLLDRYPLGIIQAPYNVFDQRMKRAGAFAALKAKGVEVHVRSAFLQGFALADPDALTPHLSRYRSRLVALRAQAARAGRTPLSLALGFVLAEPAIDRAVLGVDAAAQLDEIVAAAGAEPIPDLSAMASDELDFINPARWAGA